MILADFQICISVPLKDRVARTSAKSQLNICDGGDLSKAENYFRTFLETSFILIYGKLTKITPGWLSLC